MSEEAKNIEDKHAWRAWLQLLRLPNLLTVPGDVMAGMLLTGTAHGTLPNIDCMLAVMGASLCLYIFGLVLNDLLDIEVDRLERPDRPLPSGSIIVPQARMAAIIFVLLGLNLALVCNRTTLIVAAILGGCIILYNGGLKKVPWLGALIMGGCRGLSLLLGVTATAPEMLQLSLMPLSVKVATIGLTLYIAGVTMVASREMEAEQINSRTRWLPFIVLLLTLPLLLASVYAQLQTATLLPMAFVFVMIITLTRSWLLGGIMYRLQPVPATIGGHIRNLLMIQACFVLASGSHGIIPALLLILLSLIFQKANRHFYSS